ncbi:rna exonuclease 4 [Stemphylium lycopersici]|uniref:Rna exonuclease 4 n=1 Tax=Stemphylium lycopersici TaxID=183478 RepID=A0A364NE31_STELY|nr:rna exonuclease 4 [Stemphylium lycopersici]RAR10184.1 rna exonuclease 4 [Stemphylium lycopersici]RAR15532.1 rna exonuclease 4 [Stemphylium lycopersici]
MAKRKRGSHEEPPPVDVGLGATLAHMRGDNQADEATSAAANGGDEGWTVVGASKKRRKEHASPDGQAPPSPRSPAQSRDPDANGPRTRKDPSPPPQTEPALPNPFASNDAQRLPPTQNPFVTYKAGNAESDENLTREERRKERKLRRSYPAIEHSPHARLNSHVKITDLQTLVLYLLADGNAPQWVSVRSRANIQQVVMLMVPGLDLAMFNGDVALDSTQPPEGPSEGEGTDATPKRLNIALNDFYPASLRPDRLPAPLKPLSEIFDHVWPIKAIGEHRNNQYSRVHSPIHTMLTSQIPKTQEEKQMKKTGNHKGPLPQNSKHWENKRTRITEYIATLMEQQENEYVLHPAMFTAEESKEANYQRRKLANQTIDDGWVDTHVAKLEDGEVPEADIEQGSLSAGRHIISIDCEMCKAENDQLVLTRISLMNWDGSVAMDKLVKPDVAIKDYLTQWSGITATMLQGVTTTLADIQKELLELITPRTILVGHSLNSDLNALKLAHPFLIDTGILYPHPRGPPYKQSLKWLAQKYLKREVQKGSRGHDSVEDARTCLDLVKQKCEKGPRWGSGDTNAESIFKRLDRSMRPKANDSHRAGAVIDWGDPNRGHGGQAQVSIGCKTDAEVVEAIDRTLKGQAEGKDGTVDKIDFVWGRLRELELARGWWDDAKTADVELIRQNALERLGFSKDSDDMDVDVRGAELGDAVSKTVERIGQVYDSLPRCTAFIVYSGTGDPREVRRLQGMYQQHRREYATKNWDNLSVKWTDTEVQALSKACQDARNGVGFIVVK